MAMPLKLNGRRLSSLFQNTHDLVSRVDRNGNAIDGEAWLRRISSVLFIGNASKNHNPWQMGWQKEGLKRFPASKGLELRGLGQTISCDRLTIFK